MRLSSPHKTSRTPRFSRIQKLCRRRKPRLWSSASGVYRQKTRNQRREVWTKLRWVEMCSRALTIFLPWTSLPWRMTGHTLQFPLCPLLRWILLLYVLLMYTWKLPEVGFASNLKLDLDDSRFGLAWIAFPAPSGNTDSPSCPVAWSLSASMLPIYRIYDFSASVDWARNSWVRQDNAKQTDA